LHTYIRNNDTSYTVGVWLNSADNAGSTFWSMFDVSDRLTAVCAVNTLNGGSSYFDFTEITKEH